MDSPEEGLPSPALRSTVVIRHVGLEALSGTLPANTQAAAQRIEFAMDPSATLGLPPDYDLAEKAARLLAERLSSDRTKPSEDPEGVIVPGKVLSNTSNPDSRWLVGAIRKNGRGQDVVSIAMEGSNGIKSMSLDDLKQRIKDGRLI